MTAIDPVCGMDVEVETAQWKTEYRGQTYYFCAPGCQRRFEQDPERYLSGDPEEHGGQAAHPQE